MPAQDPVFLNFSQALPAGGGNDLVAFIRTVAIAAGWSVDEYDNTPIIGGEEGGHELYIHPIVTTISNAPRYSIKAFAGSAPDQNAIKVWMNTGYGSGNRVDNQPGMYAQTAGWPVNAANRQQVFGGVWESAPNANPGDSGMYLTVPWNPTSPLTGPVPIIPSGAQALHCRPSGIDMVYAFIDPPVGGNSSRCLMFFWYIDNVLFGLVMGHVLWDFEGIPPYDEEGHLLMAWSNVYDDRLLENQPYPNSLGGTRAAGDFGPIEVIRNRTSGSVTFPSGTVNGDPLMLSGPVVLQQGRIEASDNETDINISAIVRPDQDFESVYNNLQGDAFPNPKITIHREPVVSSLTQSRLGFHRPRHIALFPDGGPLLGNYAAGEGASNWSDCGFTFPQYYAPTREQRDGDIVVEGSRQYLLLPGNRGGAAPWTQSHRTAGLAVRIG